VRPDFIVAVTLNSADFQRRGFDTDGARAVVRMLNASSIDFIEFSGGSYEARATQGCTADGRTLAREAFFLEFARDLSRAITMPTMSTGGIGRLPVVEAALAWLARMAVIRRQLQRLAAGKAPRPAVNPAWSLLMDQVRTARLSWRYRGAMRKAA
jgi:2,4-dienoyl-CoA reductase-like NADH-dependent reductase (Old Yellow Enzyme family)